MVVGLGVLIGEGVGVFVGVGLKRTALNVPSSLPKHWMVHTVRLISNDDPEIRGFNSQLLLGRMTPFLLHGLF